jgi:phosphoglucosamine mutase
MTKRKYFGTDGVRGKVGSKLINPQFVMRLGYAAGVVLASEGTNKVLIGKDTRISGYMLESALEAGFSAAGIDVMMLGPMPTPAVAYLTKTFRAEAGVVISASHNPYYDNGIKFFNKKGEKLTDELEARIEEILDQPMGCVESDLLGKAERLKDPSGRYIEFCKSNFPSKYTLDGLKIVVDCANGAAYNIAPDVFRELGAEVIEFATSPDGININHECGATSLERLQELVVDEDADIGIALDGDADRLMMVDHKGNVLDGDQLIYIIARHENSKGRLSGGVVGTLMSNAGLEIALNKLNIPFLRADVGDRHVMEKLAKNQWALGAESSGHIINLNHTTTGDGIIAAINVLVAMCSTGETLNSLNEELVMLDQVMINVRAKVSTDDDLTNNENLNDIISKTNFELNGQGRVLLRKSGTEPVIRVMIEGNDKEKILSLANNIAQVVKSSYGI